MPLESENSLRQLLDEAHILYNNALEFLRGIETSYTTVQDFVNIELTQRGGSTTTKQLVSLTNILRRMSQLEANVAGITELADGTINVELTNSMNQVRQVVAVNFEQMPFVIESIQGRLDAIVDNSSRNPLNLLQSPNITARINLTGLVASVTQEVDFVKLLVQGLSSDEFDALYTNELKSLTYQRATQYLISNNIAYRVDAGVKRLDTTLPRFYGKFSVTSVVYNNDGTFNVSVDKTRYNDRLASALLTNELAQGNRLVSIDGTSVYEITAQPISGSSSIVVKRIIGTSDLKTGSNKLVFLNNQLEKYLSMPIFSNQMGMLYVSQIHNVHNTRTDYSLPLSFDSSKLTITVAGQRYTIDEYVAANNGVEVGKNLTALLAEIAPPAKNSGRPVAPTLTASMLQVMQINDHKLQSKDIKQIKRLNAERVTLQQELSSYRNQLSEIRQQINTSNYKNDAERLQLEKKVSNLENSYSDTEKSLTAVVNQLSSENLGTFAKNIAGKYRVRGFIPEQAPHLSADGRQLQVIRYKVEYQYLNTANETAQSAQIQQTDVDGNTTVGAFSTWQQQYTPLRQKILDESGKVLFQDNQIGDAEQINYNQLDIPISENERVKIRVKAISEAGYPTINVESEWSKPVIIEFPDDLEQVEELVKLDAAVKAEQKQIEFNKILDDAGINRHVSSSFLENNRYFAHTGLEVASGFFTAERQNISVFDKFVLVDKQVSALQEIVFNVNKDFTISIVDELGNEYSAINNGSLDIFAGYYSDEVSNSSNGEVVNKQYYLKIVNNRANPAQLNSLMPGDLLSAIAVGTDYYNAPIGFYSDDEHTLPSGRRQYYGQIVYSRTKNVTNTIDLYTAPAITNNDTVPNSEIDSANPNHQLVILDNSVQAGVRSIKLNDNSVYSDFMSVSVNLPDWQDFVNNGDTDAQARVLEYLSDVVSRFPGSNMKTKTQQSLNGGDTVQTQFEERDRYLIGENTCGAFLGINALIANNIQVDANRNDAFRSIRSGSSNALLVPINFQYRMVDALGRVNGIANYSLSTPLKYSKTIGVDIILFGQKFSFDLTIRASYKSTSIDASNLPIASAESLISRISKNSAS